ncbi:hypothetical protein Tco_0317077 [Tanacetum coccineum]
MSDSNESGVTYTEVSSLFEGLSDIGSPRADDHEYLELPGMPEDPYIEAALVHTLMIEIDVEDQPDVVDASPTAQLPDYVPESDHEVDPEEDDDEDPKEDPVDYSADGGDDGDDEDEPSEEDEDDDVDMEAGRDEEEEHPTPADSVVVALLADDQAPSAKETEPFETNKSAATPPPHRAYRVTVRISIPAPVPTPVMGYQRIRMRAKASSTSYSLPLPPPFIVSPTRLDSLQSLGGQTRGPYHLEKRLGIALGPRYEIMDVPKQREVGYGITDSWDEIVETLQRAPVSTDTELGQHITAFETRVRQDTNEIYTSDLTRTLRTTVLGQMSKIRELHAADGRRQAVTSEMLKADHRRSAKIRELRTTDHT